MPGYVALLRGINVGGRNKVPMRELASLVTATGGDDVQTYLQSGNVIFDVGADLAGTISETIATSISERFGFRVPVLLRSTRQMAEVVRHNPLRGSGTDLDDEKLHVLFLAHRPDPVRVAALDPERSSGETFVVRGQEIYLHLPNGAARTKLTNAYFDAKLGLTTSQRNWRTVTKLLELMEG